MTITEEAKARDDGIKKDYFLIRNYDENILAMRGILLKTAMNSINQIDDGKFPLENFSDKEKIVCVHVVPNSVHSWVNFVQTTDPNRMVIQTRCEKPG